MPGWIEVHSSGKPILIAVYSIAAVKEAGGLTRGAHISLIAYPPNIWITTDESYEQVKSMVTILTKEEVTQ